MAGYIVTSGANFTPFTYDELVKPIQQFTEAQYAASENFDKLALDTETLRNYIDKTNDPMAWEMYNNYAQKLQTLQDNLWSKGYNAGTVRDLSEARKGYASDITRLASAVEARQSRSKEYWDALHKDPTLVAGWDPADPIKGSLDNYLKDENYGQDWFSYSGSTLEKDVAFEMKNRAQELFDRLINSGNLNSYQDVIENVGFTNNDVQSGISLAERLLTGGQVTKTDSEKAQLVAQSIIRGMMATGANSGEDGNLSPEKFRRLFDYASRGATAGILDFNSKYLKNTTGVGSKTGSGGGGTEPTDLGYTPNNPLWGYTNPESMEAAADVNKVFIKPFQNADGSEKTMQVKNINGGLENITSAVQLTELMLQSEANKKLNSMYSNVDLNELLADDKLTQTFISGNGNEFILKKLTRGEAAKANFNGKDDIVGVYYQGKLQPEITKRFNADYVRPHIDYVNKMRNLNKDNSDINSAIISPKVKKELYETNGFDSRLPLSEFLYASAAKNTISHQSPAVLTSPGQNMDMLSEVFTDTLLSSSAISYARSGGEDSVVGEFNLFPVEEGGKGFKKEGVDATTVLDSKKGKKNLFYAYPEDVLEGKMRVLIPDAKAEFGFDIKALGDVVDGPMNSNGFRERLRRAMLIFTNPDKVYLMSEDELRKLSDDIYKLFAEKREYEQYAPNAVPENVSFKRYTASQFLHNQSARDELYAGLVGVINEKLHQARSTMEYYNQHKSGSTSKEPLNLNSTISQ